MKKALILVSVLLFALLCVAQTQGAAHPEMVVSTEWLAAHLNDPNVVVLQVVKTPEEFAKGHIPGARPLLYGDFMDMDSPRKYEVPKVAKLKANFERLGVSNDSRVVLYSAGWMPWAARAWFTFDYLGLGGHAALLDGGIQAWAAGKREVSTEPATPAKPGALRIDPHREDVVKFKDVKRLAKAGGNNGKQFLVDARPEKRYTAGHINGATNIFWQKTVESAEMPKLRPADELRKLWTEQGYKTDEKSVSYCETGIQGAQDYFIARYLGFPAALYDGSFHEWDAIKKQPAVVGAEKTGPLVESKGDMRK